MDIGDPLVKQRASINPYRWGMKEIIRRLRWDLHRQSWSSRKKMLQYQNQYSGEKAVILCNGPSLNKVNFDLLTNDCVSFGLNKINLLFDRTVFRPNYIVSVNPYAIEQNQAFFNSTDIELFLDSKAVVNKWIQPGKNKTFLHSSSTEGFARDCSISIFQGYTVTYVALQIAFHMGFKTVALVGADHDFSEKGPANKLVFTEGDDSSHFDPRYFSGVSWQLPDLFESEVAYGRARQVYEAHGKVIYNCTEGGKLEVFERMSLHDFLNQ